MASVTTYDGDYLVCTTSWRNRVFQVKYIPRHKKGPEYDIAIRESVLNDLIDGTPADEIKRHVSNDMEDLSIYEKVL